MSRLPTKRWTVMACLGAIAGVAAGLALVRASDSGSADEALPGDIPKDKAVEYVLNLAAEEQQVYAMEWGTDGKLWFVGSASGGEITLNSYDPAARRRERWDLPGLASPGPFTYLVQTGDGMWWIAANYSLWRFDPDAGEADIRVVLDRNHPLRTAEADDPGAPLPGTWVNGMKLAGGRLYLTRNNVRALFELMPDGSLHVSREIAGAPAGLALIKGQPTPYHTMAEVFQAVGDLGLRGDGSGSAFAESGGCRVALDPASGSATLAGDTMQVLSGLPVQAGDMARVSAGGDVVALALSEGSTILRSPCGEGNVERFQFPVTFVRSSEPLLRGGHLLAERDDAIMTVRSSIVSLAVSPSGEVAFSDDAMRIGIIR